MNVEPLTILAGTLELTHESPRWTLAQVAESDGRRSVEGKITFERAFLSAPVVHVGLAGFDISNDAAARIALRTIDITANGFLVQVETWVNTRVWSVTVNWVALGV